MLCANISIGQIVGKNVIIIGAGPAGLMAAQKLAESGVNVTVYEKKKSPARKFLLAGRGGLNLTHSEASPQFTSRYRQAEEFMVPLIESFSPEDLRQWCRDLGEETFIGSSGRIFPTSFKASPLLRAWLKRLETLCIKFEFQQEWMGWKNGKTVFKDQNGSLIEIASDATLLALGGASWPHLGSDGKWAQYMKEQKIEIADFRPANSGFHVSWSDVFQKKFAGQALKNIALHFQDKIISGEIMIDKNGVEGGAIYALSAEIREALAKQSPITLTIDLKPSLSQQEILKKLLNRPRQRQSFSSYLERTLNLTPLALHLMREADMTVQSFKPEDVAALVKALPVKLISPFGIERSISTAGGISLNEINEFMMLHKIKSVFVAGEMLDWEAPTGGYLLQGCFSSAVKAAEGILCYLNSRDA